MFFSVTMSLDGFIAPEQRRDDPDVQRGAEPTQRVTHLAYAVRAR